MPKTIKKSVFWWCCTACYWILLSSDCWADRQTEYQQSIDNIGEQITRITTSLNADRALLKTEQGKLSSAEQRVAALRQALAATAVTIAQQQVEGARIQEKIDNLLKEQKSDQQALVKLIRERYTRGQPNYLKMLLNQQNPYAVGRLSNYYDYFSAAQQSKLSHIRTQITQTKALQESKLQLLNELQFQRQQQSAQQRKLDQAKAKRIRIVARLDEKITTSSDQLKQLRQDRARLNKLLQQIAAQARELRRLEQEKADEEKRRQQQDGTPKVTRPPVTGGFLKQRGRLSYPVSGTQKYRFGSRILESGMRAQGAFFDTINPVPVKTIFRGRVLFADYLKGYGLLMIVDHGDDHISLYGHNELLYKRVGDLVETNEIVARSGISGGLKSPGLYFEIRKSATPVDPAAWCR